MTTANQQAMTLPRQNVVSGFVVGAGYGLLFGAFIGAAMIRQLYMDDMNRGERALAYAASCAYLKDHNILVVNPDLLVRAK